MFIYNIRIACLTANAINFRVSRNTIPACVSKRLATDSTCGAAPCGRGQP